MSRWLFCCGLIFILTAQAAAETRNLALRPSADAARVALVIGNSAYPLVPLRNPANDARDIAAKLKRLGFDVIVRTDVRQKEMLRSLTEFGDKVQAGTEVLFFYAGHGMQVRGKNYLIPIDAEIRNESSVSSEAVDVDQLLDKLAPARLSMVILDACRNNPFERRFRGGGQGLAQINAPTGTLIAYATAPGKVAADGEGRNGLYTSELLAAMDVPGIKIEDVFKRVRANVVRKSGEAQTPWESSSLTGDFYFTQGSLPQGTTDNRASLLNDAETALWSAVERGGSEDDYAAYLGRYPNGKYLALAEQRYQKLKERNRLAETEEARRRTEMLAQTERDNRQRYERLLAEGDEALKSRDRKVALAKFEQAQRLFQGSAELVPRLEQARALASAGEIFRDRLKDGSPGPEMLVLPAGKFRMGDVEGNADGYSMFSLPVREVVFRKPLAIGRFEITFEEFDQFSKATGRNLISDHGWGRGRRPATKIVWDEAIAYVQWLSAQTGKTYRIPTEAEWEYAARAGTQTNYWWGSQPSHEYANYGSGQPGWFPRGVVDGRDQWEFTAPVGQFPANPFGLHDMQGNVWEWVADCWQDSLGATPADATARGSTECENRVMRGGSWGYNPNFMRASSRVKVFWAVLSYLYYGIRVVRELE